MVTVRISRIGKKNRPYWRIVAVDSRKKRDGMYLEDLGTYDPIKHKLITINSDGIKSWVAKGAQCSLTVDKILRRQEAAQK